MTVKYEQLHQVPGATLESGGTDAAAETDERRGMYVPPEAPGKAPSACDDDDDDDDIEAFPIATTPIAEPIPEAPVVAVLGFDDKETRMTFIRRVYSILAVQMLVTGGVCTFMVLHLPTQEYVLTHMWPINTTVVLSIVLVIALMCYKDVHPHNIILLALFTIVESFLVGTVTAAYCVSGYKGVVLEAVFLTCAVFIGLTVFTFQSRIDFSFLGASLSMGLGVLLVWGFCAVIFGFYDGYYYALFGCVIFCGYILFDTWLIMEKLQPHEYVLAAVMLYLDLINLFLYILRLLAASNRN
eukprot:CAMPEP_0197433998 /NCGR_PEP_ID=MMETSP1175-20131217/1790_1 /TAXON_ID=1003142 /ORGANISM="Triceratium dubium, Strain CCMP147" /LENGTH=297 /DNA_ID=CAMNT_0042962559 /DNA_START=6 /DNA_END=899 /DNA_ORIENTATION=-